MTKGLIRLFAIGSLSVVVIGLLTGFDPRNSGFEIQLHDTYLIFGKAELAFVLFLNLTFWILLIQQIVDGFKRLSGNIILMITSGILILLTSMEQEFFMMHILPHNESGWTLYPPASATGNVSIPRILSILYYAVKGYIVLQIVITGLTGIMIGRELRIGPSNK